MTRAITSSEIDGDSETGPGNLEHVSPKLTNSDSPSAFKEAIRVQVPHSLLSPQYRYCYSTEAPRRVPCVVLSPSEDMQKLPLSQASATDSPLDSIMAKISKLSTSPAFSVAGGLSWTQSESYHEDNLRESVELYDSMKQIVKDNHESCDTGHGKCSHQNINFKESASGKLSFGIDRILGEGRESGTHKDEAKALSTPFVQPHSDVHVKYISHCADCYLLSRFCYKYSPPRTPASLICQSTSNCSAAMWTNPMTHLQEHNGNFLQANGYRNAALGSFSHASSPYPGISSIVGCNTNNGNGRRKRSWSRAVFSNLQRKGLEKRFQIQKYITKPDRRQLAATLGLTDAQVSPQNVQTESEDIDNKMENDSLDSTKSQDHSKVLKFHADKEGFIRHLTMGIDDTLQAHPMIKDIKMTVRPPVTSFLLTSWERRYGLKLPLDLRGYYSSTNGFNLSWTLVYADEVLNVGNLCINTLQQLTPVETTLQSMEKDDTESDPYKPTSLSVITIPLTEVQKVSAANIGEHTLDWRQAQAFRLNSSKPEAGSVFLVYTQSQSRDAASQIADHKVQIWFLDRALQWHYLAPSFSTYYKMAIFHLGLPDWTYRFTMIGLSSWTEQIVWLIAPKLLQPLKRSSNPDNASSTTGVWSSDPPPEALRPNDLPKMLTLSMLKKKKKGQAKP